MMLSSATCIPKTQRGAVQVFAQLGKVRPMIMVARFEQTTIYNPRIRMHLNNFALVDPTAWLQLLR